MHTQRPGGRMRRSGRQNVYQSKVVDILSTTGAPPSPPLLPQLSDYRGDLEAIEIAPDSRAEEN